MSICRVLVYACAASGIEVVGVASVGSGAEKVAEVLCSVLHNPLPAATAPPAAKSSAPRYLDQQVGILRLHGHDS